MVNRLLILIEKNEACLLLLLLNLLVSLFNLRFTLICCKYMYSVLYVTQLLIHAYKENLPVFLSAFHECIVVFLSLIN